LLELVVAVAIFGLIAGIVTVSFVHGREGASVTASEATLKTLASDEEQFFAEHAYYVAGASDFATFGKGSDGSDFIPQTEPLLAPSGSEYSIATPTVHTYVIIDPATYDPPLLRSVIQGDGTTGVATFPSTYCVTCRHLGYGSSGGLIGW
jgi:type II secretory pathway pseudopilin PulG